MGDIERFFKEQTDPTHKWEEWKKQNQGKSTPTLYQAGLDYFLDFNKIETMNELYEIQLQAAKRGATDPLSKYVVHDMIRKTVNHRIEVDGVGGGHAKAVKSAVVKFMRLCGFEDFTMRLPKGITKIGSNGGSDIATPEMLKVALSVTHDLQKKALIMVLKDSGFRIGDSLSLDHEDIREAIETRAEFYHLKKVTQKTNDRAQTVLGPEAIQALRDWIRFRRGRGETLTDSTPVFIKKRLTGGQPKAKTDPAANLAIKSETRLTLNAASNQISRVFRTAGYSGVTAHGLRQMHDTYLGIGEDRVPEPMIARMEGRIISDSREAYKKYPPQDLVDAYSRNYHQIQVYATESKQVKDLNERVKHLELEKVELNRQLKAAVAMQAQVDDLTEKYDSIMYDLTVVRNTVDKKA